LLEAVLTGQLGTIEDRSVVVTLKQFKTYFSDVTGGYINLFLPASTIEPGAQPLPALNF